MTLWAELGRRILSGDVTDEPGPSAPVLAQTTLIDGTNWPGAGSSVHLFTDDVAGLVRSVPYTTIYQTNPWLWAVVQLKARSFSRMPPKVFRREGTLDVRAYEGRGAQLEARLRKPGGGVSWQARQKATMVDYQVTGNALWVINSDRAGINGFDLVPWSTIRVERDSATGDVFYGESSTTIEWDGVTSSNRRWPEQQVIHFGFGENPSNPYRNPSPIGSLQATLALFDAVYQQVLNFFNNGARPSAHFKIDRATDPAVLSAVTTSIREAMAGTKNAGKVFVSPGDYQPITSGPDQTRVIELAKQSREEICGVFGVAPPLVGILERAIFCLPGEATISTTQGPRRIDKMRAGDEVWAFDGQAVRPFPVAWAGRTGELPTFRVVTANRTLTATGNHPVLVARRPVRLRDKSGRPSRYGPPEWAWVRVDELERGDLIIAAHGFGTADKNEIAPNGRELTIEFMELMGLLMGDGWVTDGTVNIAHARNARYIEHYLQVAQDVFTKRGGRPICLNTYTNCTRFRSKSAFREIKQLGFSGSALTKRVPGWVHALAEPLQLAFLRGFMDADGSVDKQGRITVGIANEGLRDDLWHMCMALGIPVSNRRYSERQVTFPQGTTGTARAWWLNLADPGANRRIGSHDPQDVARLENGRPFDRKVYEYPDRMGKVLPSPVGGQLSKIRSVEPTGETVPVFDLTVPGVHSFVADGVVVHNSNVRELRNFTMRDTVGPDVELIAGAITSQVSFKRPVYNGITVDFEAAAQLKPDLEAIADTLPNQLRITTPNELRAKFNLPMLDDPAADQIWNPQRADDTDGQPTEENQTDD